MCAHTQGRQAWQILEEEENGGGREEAILFEPAQRSDTWWISSHVVRRGALKEQEGRPECEGKHA